MNNELFSTESSGGICGEYEGREAAILLVER
jgi:hypothetical protein